VGEGRLASALLRLPVRSRGVGLGYPIDLILDSDARRVLGFEVRCGDESVRLLPFGAAELRADEISVDSPLLLLEPADVSFYERRGRSLRALRGGEVHCRARSAGQLRDVVVADDGAITHVVAADDAGERRLPADGAISLGRGGEIPVP